MQILADKDEIHTAKSELSYTKEDVCGYSPRPATQCSAAQNSAVPTVWPEPGSVGSGERGLRHGRVGEEGAAGPGAQLLGVPHQQVHAVDADRGHEHQSLREL